MKNRFLKNTFWLVGGQVLRMAISLVVNLLTARYLGPSNYGVLNYIASYIAFFTALTGLGLNGVIIYQFVNRREEEGKILGTALVLRLLTGILSSAAFLLLIFLTDGGDRVMMTVALLQAIQLPFLAFDTVNYWYQSRLLSRYAVIAQTVAYIITAAYKVFLLATGKSIEWFAFALSLDAMMLAALYLFFYRRHRVLPMRFSRPVAARLLRAGLPFILADLMVVIYGQMDKIMLRQLLDSDAAVGLYSAALAICSLISFIPAAILDSGRPVISAAKETDEALYNLRIRQLFAALIWISILYSTGITLLAPLAVRILYGADYLGAIPCLRIAVWYTVFSYLGSGRSLWLICEKKSRYVFFFSAIGAATNLGLNWFLIPRFGINGAAGATLFTQFLTNFLLPSFFRQTRGYSRCVADAFLLRNMDLRHLVSGLKSVLRRK